PCAGSGAPARTTGPVAPLPHAASAWSGPPPPGPAADRVGGRGAGLTIRRERAAAGVPGRVVELLLDPQELVVLGDPLRPRRRAGLDLAAPGRHREVRDGGVLGLAGAVAHHAPHPGPVGQVHGVE